MEGENHVRLHGMWASPYSKKVELALQIKGITYEYVEEDLQNKSQALVEYNPVHKKVPVLVHNGKPLIESLAILEYIDEVWPTYGPRLLPDDPYERAMVRFWSNYLTNQLLESVLKLFKTSDEASHETIIEEIHEKMSLIEQEMSNFIPKDVSSIKQDSLGLLDILMITLLGAYKAQEEVVGKKMLDQEKHPRIYSWVNALINLPLIQDNTPPHDKLVAILQMFINASY